MKFRSFYIGAFIATLLIGYLSVLSFFSKPVTRGTVEPAVPEIKLAEPAPISEKPAEPLEVFDVDRDFFSEGPDHGIEILETGEGWRLEKTRSRSGDELLGLYYRDHESFLKRGKVSITNDKDDWKNISVKNNARPRFLLKNARMLHEGKVVTLFSGFSSFDDETSNYGYEISNFRKGYPREFRLGDTEYVFRIKKGLSRSKEKIQALFLENGRAGQIIDFSYYSDLDGDDSDNMADNLLWAGDLDHDNKLDFYLEFFNEKGSYSTGLFLSSEAEKGKLVKMVAGFTTIGC